jgi:hypothetical protein
MYPTVRNETKDSGTKFFQMTAQLCIFLEESELMRNGVYWCVLVVLPANADYCQNPSSLSQSYSDSTISSQDYTA